MSSRPHLSGAQVRPGDLMRCRRQETSEPPSLPRAGLQTPGKITTTNPWLRLPIPRGGTGLPWRVAGGGGLSSRLRIGCVFGLRNGTFCRILYVSSCYHAATRTPRTRSTQEHHRFPRTAGAFIWACAGVCLSLPWEVAFESYPHIAYGFSVVPLVAVRQPSSSGTHALR